MTERRIDTRAALGHIFQFVKAVWKQYVILLTSSAAIAIAVVWEHYRGASIGRPLFLGLAGFLLIGAFFRAWRNVYVALQVEQSKRTSIESELSNALLELTSERSKRGLEEVQLKLAEASLEKLNAEKKQREERGKHEERLSFLTAPDTGIRYHAAEQRRLRNLSAMVFTVEMLVRDMNAKQGEIEEALRILQNRGFAKETNIRGRWLIQ
jgi:hypothetical protein